MAASAPGPQMLALPRLSANVVMANAASPNGAGSAVEYACGMAGSGPSATSSRLVKSDFGDICTTSLRLIWKFSEPTRREQVTALRVDQPRSNQAAVNAVAGHAGDRP